MLFLSAPPPKVIVRYNELPCLAQRRGGNDLFSPDLPLSTAMKPMRHWLQVRESSLFLSSGRRVDKGVLRLFLPIEGSERQVQSPM